MSEKKDIYITALEGKKIPILTLDHKWHQIFQHAEATPEIRKIKII